VPQQWQGEERGHRDFIIQQWPSKWSMGAANENEDSEASRMFIWSQRQVQLRSTFCYTVSVRNWLEGLSEKQKNMFFISVMISGLLGMQLIYGLARGKFSPDHCGMTIGLPITFWIFGVLAKRKGNTPESIDLPKVERTLSSVGARNPKVMILRGQQNREYPRPAVYGELVSLSERALADLSEAAVLWFTKTEFLSQKRTNKHAGVVLGLGAILLLVVLGLMQRFKAPDWWLLIVSAVIVFGFAWGFRDQGREQFRADLETTISSDDYLAAKEALSYAYFVQVRRTRGQRFMFNPKEMERRAKSLGIELEEGYRVPGAEGIRVGE